MKKTLAIAALLISLSVLAQHVRQGMSQGPYYKGVAFQFQIAVENVELEKPPVLSDCDDFTVQAQPPSSSTNSSIRIINGKREESHTTTTAYNFFITPRKTGRITIPACQVTINGKTSQTRPVTVDVSQVNTNATITLDCTPAKNVCALGEPVVFSFIFTSSANLQNISLDIPLLTMEGVDTQPVELPERFANSRGALMLSTSSGTRIPALQRVQNNKIVISFSITAIPRKAGKVTVAAPSAVCDAIDMNSPQRRQRRGFPFDDDDFPDPFGMFGRRYNTVKCAAEGRPCDLTIKEPPAEGRPVSYTGLAEPCSISVTADKDDVYVGDPIVLSITLSGPQFPASIILPKLSALPAFKNAFRVFDNDAPAQTNPDSSVTFKRTIRAASTEVTEIPPVEISWFDATDNQYHTVSSAAIKINVKATRTATAVATSSGAAPVPAVEETDKVDVVTATGPQGNFPVADCIVNQYRPEKEAVMALQPSYLALAGLPLLCLLLTGLRAFVLHKRQHADAYRAKGAARNASRCLSHLDTTAPDAYANILKGVNAFIADKALLNPDTVTLQDAEAFLDSHHVDIALMQRLESIINNCESAIYANNKTISAEALLTEARALVSDLDQALDASQKKAAKPLRAILFLLLATGLAMPLMAEETVNGKPLSETLQQAEDLYLKGLQADKDNDRNAAKQAFSQATDLYNQCLALPNFDNARLRYNLGNVYLARHELGQAIWQYRTALTLQPDDNAPISSNLNLARAQRKDSFVLKENTRVLKTLFFFHYDLELSTRRIIFYIAYTIFWLTLTCRLLTRRHTAYTSILIIAGLLALVFAVSLGITATSADNSHGVITSKVVHAKTGASNSYPDAFETPLHDGTEFVLIGTDASKAWNHIRLPNSEKCWIPATSALLLVPESY